MEKNNTKILVIIPAYNEQDSIDNTVSDLIRNCQGMDYVVINDCSSDHTEAILKNRKYNYINLPVNLGIGGGVQTGYLYASKMGYDIAIQMDGDGQHNAAYIETLITPILEGKADVVIGSRYITKEGFQSSALRRLGIGFLSGLIKICTGVSVKDATSGFRAVNKRFLHLFAREYAQDYPEPEAIVLSSFHGARIQEVPVIMNERESGNSSISGMKSLYYMVKVSLSIILLRITLGRKKNEC